MKTYINIIILFFLYFLPLIKSSDSECGVNYELSYYANNSRSIFISESFYYIYIENKVSSLYEANATNPSYYFKYIVNELSDTERIKFIISKNEQMSSLILSCNAKLPLRYQKRLLVNCDDDKNSNLSINFTSNGNNNGNISFDNNTYHIVLDVSTRKHFVILNALYNDSQIYGNIIIFFGMFITLYGAYYSKFTMIIYSICLTFTLIKEVQEILSTSLDFEIDFFPFIIISALIIGGFLGYLFAYHLPEHPFMGFLFGMILYYLISIYCVIPIISNYPSCIAWYNIMINNFVALVVALFFGFLWNKLTKKQIGSKLTVISTSFVGSYMMIYGVSLFVGGYFLEKPFYILFNNVKKEIVKKYWTNEMFFYLGLFFGLFILSFLFQLHTLVAFNFSNKKEDKITALLEEDKKENGNIDKSCEKSKDDSYNSMNDISQPEQRVSRLSEKSYRRVSMNNMSYRNSNVTFEGSGSRMNQEGGE